MDHLQRLKSFLWKYGGGLHRLDSFRISEVDLVEWEKKCKLLTKDAINEGSQGPIIGPLNGFMNSRQFIKLDGWTESCITTGVMTHVLSDEGTANGEGSSRGLEKLPQIPSLVCDKAKGNVHSGGPPPLFNSTEGSQFDEKLKSGKPSKLNPKRVGAAWAERRKIDLEMEKRGEVVPTNFDANWLPNFGNEWQSGSRKKARKDFEGETDASHKVENQAGMPFQLQPYVSKRLQRDASE